MSVSYDINSVLHTTMSKLKREYAASQDPPYKMGVVYDISSSVQTAKTQANVVIAHHHVMQDVLATMLNLLKTPRCTNQHKQNTAKSECQHA